MNGGGSDSISGGDGGRTVESSHEDKSAEVLPC